MGVSPGILYTRTTQAALKFCSHTVYEITKGKVVKVSYINFGVIDRLM